MYKIKLQEKLFLILDLARHYQRNIFNTNDLAQLANKYREDLVRRRKDKLDYKYLDDTKFGGLRGNFSNIISWKGVVKRGTKIISYYSIGRNNRLVNAVCNGKVILNHEDMTACTNNTDLKRLLEKLSWLYNVREAQSHVKILVSKNKKIPLKRECDNFSSNEAVFVSENDKYFLRAKINGFADDKGEVLEFKILNYWQGTKYKRKNIHLLLFIPNMKSLIGEIYAIKHEELSINKPLTIYYSYKNKKCYDLNNNTYNLHKLKHAIDIFSGGNSNEEERVNYDWKKLRDSIIFEEVDFDERKEDEFSEFLELFLDWQQCFKIAGKEVVKVKSISSGGPDVELLFSGGTSQKLELEHKWKNYLDHGHHKDNAFTGVWLFATEEWDEAKIIKVFKKQKTQYGERVPDVFLCINNGKRKVYCADWDNNNFKELELNFK